MKKKTIVLTAVIILAITAIIYLIPKIIFLDYQKIKTDKVVYSSGEKISYSLMDFRLCRCQNGEDEIEFYRQINNQWELIPVAPETVFGYCLDGEQGLFIGSPLYCEEYNFFDKPLIRETGDREIKIYERIADGPCKSFSTKENEELFKGKSLPSYVSKPAPAGLYKIKFGKAEATFEIK